MSLQFIYFSVEIFLFLKRRLPPRSTRTDPLFPYTTRFRSQQVAANPIPVAVVGVGLAWLMMANKQPQRSAQQPDRSNGYGEGYGGTAEFVTGEIGRAHV